jgi:PAS domain S-box-containing protein
MSDEKKNILLVEDELIVAHAEAQTLKNNGYSVIISPNASHAIETVKSGGEIDLILMDIDLGKGMDGTDAAEIILRERDIPILFLSSHTEPEIVDKTEKITSYGYIVKNTGDTVLFASINMAFRLHEARVQTKMHGQMLRIALSERMRAEEELHKMNKQLSSTIEKLESINKEMLQSRSELMERDRALMESEAIIRNLVNNLPLGIHRYRLEPDGRLIFEGSNPAADRMLGVDNSQFIGMPIEEAFPGLVETEVPARYRQACSSGTPWHTEQIKYEDNKIKGAFEVHAFQTEPGRMAALFSVITERKKTEEALLKSEERFRSLFEESPNAIVIINSEGIVTDINPAHQQLTGHLADELIGLHFAEFPNNIKEHISEYHAIFSEMLKGKKFYNLEVELKHKNGMVIYTEFDIAPLQIREKKGDFQIIIKDITDRKISEKALSKMLDDKDILLRELHHRVKNSFAIITGIVGLESNRLNDPAMRDVLMDIRNRIGSLSNLYTILNHEHEVKDIRLDHYLKQMSHSLIDSYASDKNRITLRVDLAEIHIDVSRAISIGLIVNELLTNAFKYAFPGVRKGSIGIMLKREETKISIEVSDNGVKLPSDFNINKTKGLGLELVRLLTNQLDGTIAIESDGETVFRISIPL